MRISVSHYDIIVHIYKNQMPNQIFKFNFSLIISLY